MDGEATTTLPDEYSIGTELREKLPPRYQVLNHGVPWDGGFDSEVEALAVMHCRMGEAVPEERAYCDAWDASMDSGKDVPPELVHALRDMVPF